MIKGCQRKMIVVQGKDKSIFETAYFVLRHESEQKELRECDMLSEATRIINESSVQNARAGRFRSLRRGLWLFWGGFLLGGGGGMLLGFCLFS